MYVQYIWMTVLFMCINILYVCMYVCMYVCVYEPCVRCSVCEEEGAVVAAPGMKRPRVIVWRVHHAAVAVSTTYIHTYIHTYSYNPRRSTSDRCNTW